jgi:hypothetical protein
MRPGCAVHSSPITDHHTRYHGGLGRGCGVGLCRGVALGVAVAVEVGVGVNGGVTVAVAVAVAVTVGVAVAVGVAVIGGVGVDPQGGVAPSPLGIGLHHVILTVSTRQPSLEPLLSLAILHRSTPLLKPIPVTTVVMKP